MSGDRDVIGVLLAGGRSLRMGGGDKCLRLLAGSSMLAHVIARLGPQVHALTLNANGDPARFADFGLPVVADTVEGFAGPLAGVLAGMRFAAERFPAARCVAVAATDTPFLPHDLVAKLRAKGEERLDCVTLAASSGGIHPVCGLFPVALADDLSAALQGGVRKALDWTARHDLKTVHFPDFPAAGRMIDPFLNANSPGELAEAEAIARSLMAA
jgi:molybdopterin-guanine dinucleotide biosynthesis protein A